MSVNVYLSEEVRKHPEFNAQTTRIFGMSVFNERGRLHVILNDSDITPSQLEPFVTDVSLYASLPTVPKRERGVYVDGDSRAELENYNLGGQNQKPSYQAKVTSKKLDAAWDIVRKIKAGTIRPTESFEGAQQGLSRAELEAKLAETEGLLTTATELAAHLGKRHRLVEADRAIALNRVEAVQDLAIAIEKELWPWSSKSSMAERILKAANTTPAIIQ